MSKPLQFALIGCGMLGRVHTNIVAQIEGARMAAFCDVALPAAQAFQAEFNGDYATDDLNRIWEDPNIDAVYICTRHDSHTPLAIAAAKAGKHVMLEKPLGMTYQECIELEKTVNETGTFLMPAFKLRFYPAIVKARQFIPNPQLVTGQIADARWPDGHWAQDPVFGGGSILGQGCHATDIIRFLSGSEFRSINAVGGAISHPGAPVLDHCAAGILWENGTIASYINGDSGTAPVTGKFFFQIFGDGRSVEITDRGRTATFSADGKTWTETDETELGFELESREFIAALQEGRAPSVNVHDGVEAMNIVFALQASIAANGTPITHADLS